jgi:hypothetical protein
MNIYRKYADEALTFDCSKSNFNSFLVNSTHNTANNYFINYQRMPAKEKSVGELSALTKSSSTNSLHALYYLINKTRINEQKPFAFLVNYSHAFDFEYLQNSNPAKLVSEKSYKLYENNIEVSNSGGKQPSEQNIAIYESYVKQRLLEATIQ